MPVIETGPLQDSGMRSRGPAGINCQFDKVACAALMILIGPQFHRGFPHVFPQRRFSKSPAQVQNRIKAEPTNPVKAGELYKILDRKSLSMPQKGLVIHPFCCIAT